MKTGKKYHGPWKELGECGEQRVSFLIFFSAYSGSPSEPNRSQTKFWQSIAGSLGSTKYAADGLGDGALKESPQMG